MNVLTKIIKKAEEEANKIISETKNEVENKLKELEIMNKKEIEEYENELKKKLEKEISIFENSKRLEVKNEIMKKKKEIIENCYSNIQFTDKEKKDIINLILNYLKNEKIKELIASEDFANLIKEIKKEINVKVDNKINGIIAKGDNFEYDFTLETLKNKLKKEVFEKVK